jgi:uncharacterized protein (DUF58 family)
MLIPSRRLLAAITIALLLAIAASFVSPNELWWVLAASGLAIVAAVDAIRLARMVSPTATRSVPTSLALGLEHEVSVRLTHTNKTSLTVECHDHHPADFTITGLPRTLRIDTDTWASFQYAARPTARGDHVFEPLEIRLHSPLGLWQQRRRVGSSSPVRVYPNFAAITKFALLATDNRLSQIGVLLRRRRGEGLDFHQLREYRRGDALRQIDWKASSRVSKLISREYQDERNQQVVFLLDCGRRMGAQDGALSHFDHMLNAALLLSYVSLRQGDAVGLLTMGHQTTGSFTPERFLAPRKSPATVNVILNRVFDLQPTLASSDYYAGALELMKRVNKRALIVVLSNLRDEDDDDLISALKLMRSRHLVLFASLREQILGGTLNRPVERFDQALTHLATAEYLRQRERAFAKIAQAGAIMLDVEPDRLAVQLVNRYLEVKRSGRL